MPPPTTSGYASSDFNAPQRKRLSFDPTINAGHVLTALITLVSAFSAGMAAWSSLKSDQAMQDKRTTLLESRIDAMGRLQEQRDSQQDLLVREAVVSIRESVAELRGDMKQVLKERSQR